MRKLIAFALMTILVLSCLSFVSCGGGKKEEATEQGTQETTLADVSDQQEEKKAQTGGGWKDIPEYKGADEVQASAEMNIPGARKDEYEKAEHKAWETSDAPEKVYAYYLKEMPPRGWEKIMNMKYPEGSTISVWQQDDGEKGCVVSSGKQRDGKTHIGIMRFEGRK
jgi:hypothetical protein